MAFEKTIQLKNCRYDYTLSPSVKKFTLKDEGVRGLFSAQEIQY